MGWDEIEPGPLVDTDIIKLAETSLLFTEGFERGGVKQACYELRASDIFWEVAAQRENKRVVVDDNGYLLRPHAFVTAIVKERIELPSDVLARILTKGQLLSIGILPVNTYADPGFEGRLGITLCNISHRYVVISPGQEIAKIEFTKLQRPVSDPYSGQHGYESEIWPFPFHHYADESSEWFSNQLESKEAETRRSYGPRIAQLSSRLDWYSRKVWLQLLLILAVLAVVAALHDQLSLFQSLLIGIAANVAVQFAPSGVAWLRHRTRSRP